MSSPIALEKRAASQRALVALHQRLAHGRRVGMLAERLSAQLGALPATRPLRCLDVGCGDMTLAEAVQARVPGSDWSCIDVHALPAALRADPRWSKYRRFDGTTIPCPDRSFDAALLCDVLHHAPERASILLAEAGRVASHVIVKDHFEYGLYSRSVLRLMDFVGNWGYGVSVPRRYFSRASFERIAAESGLTILTLDCGIDLYAHLPVARALLRPDWQFVAVLRR